MSRKNSSRKYDSVAQVSDLPECVFDSNAEVPTEQWFYEDFIAPGDIVPWVGKEKHRKTNVALQFAMSAATGLDFLGFQFVPKKPLRVVMVDFETKPGSLWKRYEAIREAMQLTERQEEYLHEKLYIIQARSLLRKGKSLPKFGTANNDFWADFRRTYPAKIYVFDPMRSMHSEDENDSSIESLLMTMRQVFRNSAVVIPHHMRKQSYSRKEITLRSDMRLWSDGARGISAIKAHADVIICQERRMEGEDEVVDLGAFLKDGADIEPMALEESDHESFYWQLRTEMPEHLRSSFEVLRKKRKFKNLNTAAHFLQRKEIKKPTAYRHLKELKRLGFLVVTDGRFEVRSENDDS